MNLLEIIIIAVGLSMDAFAVSITLGLSVKKPGIKEVLLPGIYFGFFQALMPLVGYFSGINFAGKIQSSDHWIAFVLLGLITFCISTGGVKIGNIFGAKFKSKAEFIGGVILVILGLKILIEHFVFPY